jgi:hypothetical protein
MPQGQSIWRIELWKDSLEEGALPAVKPLEMVN